MPLTYAPVASIFCIILKITAMKPDDKKDAQEQEKDAGDEEQMALNLDTGKMEKIKKPEEKEGLGDFFSGSDGGSAGDGGGA